jgi:tight adherence protein B
VGITLGAALLVLLLTGGSILAALLAIAFGVLVPWLYLGAKESKRKKAFAAQLPDTLQLIAGSLAAGYSLPQAIGAATADSPAPTGVEFDRALVEARLGVPIEDALEGIAQRLESIDFSWVVMAIRIQRDVGGNLAEVLNTTAATLRERDRLRRQIDVLSAEGRFSAWILGGLPLAVGLWLALTRPDYLAPLVTSLLGWIMVFVGTLLMVVGVFWLRKTVKVEV